MPRHEDRHSSSTRLYVGRLSSRTRSRDLEDIFSKYGRIRDVDMKRDYAFVEFSNSRDADDAKYSLNGREVDGSRISVEVAKGVPRSGYGGGGGGGGGSREYQGRGPTPGSGRCFNCGIEGHWARDCKGGDWKNKCYRCGDRGHIERNCQNSPEKTGRARSYSRSPSPRGGRGRSRSYSRSRSLSRSRSPPPRRERERSRDRGERRRSRSPKQSPRPSRGRKHSPTPDRSPSDGGERRRSRSPKRSPRPSRGRKHSPTPERSPSEGGVFLTSPKGTKPEAIVTKSTSPSPVAENGRSISPSRSLSPRGGSRSPIGNDGSPRGSPTGSN